MLLNCDICCNKSEHTLIFDTRAKTQVTHDVQHSPLFNFQIWISTFSQNKFPGRMTKCRLAIKSNVCTDACVDTPICIGTISTNLIKFKFRFTCWNVFSGWTFREWHYYSALTTSGRGEAFSVSSACWLYFSRYRRKMSITISWNAFMHTGVKIITTNNCCFGDSYLDKTNFENPNVRKTKRITLSGRFRLNKSNYSMKKRREKNYVERCEQIIRYR